MRAVTVAAVFAACVISAAVVNIGLRVASSPTRPGSILLSDDLTDASNGKLPKTSSDPSDYSRGYAAGDYVMATFSRVGFDQRPSTDVTFPHQLKAPIPGTFANVSIAVEAQLSHPQDDQYVNVACRQQREAWSSYRVSITPSAGIFQVNRWKDGIPQSLIDGPQQSSVINRGRGWNRLELTCSGRTIAARINGINVASASDDAFAEGETWIGMGQSPPWIHPPLSTPAAEKIEGHFKNLIVAKA